MAKQFGNTWWGAHWLKSLDNIDYGNRLPRGATYARNGHVEEVKIIENQITAKVAGSRPKPYKVTIIVPPFFQDKIDLLMAQIVERPMIISRLLNRELDPEILEISEKAGLKVFPRQWTDFKMQCSCPDWAVPCKHLAAVIYMVSQEIDNNPFLVFQIHKVNLIDELHKRGIHIESNKNTEIGFLTDLLKSNKKTIPPFLMPIRLISALIFRNYNLLQNHLFKYFRTILHFTTKAISATNMPLQFRKSQKKWDEFSERT